MNRIRTIVATTAAALFLIASSASAATVTFTFFKGTGYTPDLPSNVVDDSINDLCGGGNQDICATMLEFQKNGITLQVTANGTDRQLPYYVNEDISPDWGGLGVDGGSPNPGGDNNGPGEMLELTFSVPVKLKSFIAFRDHKNFFEGSGNPQIPTQILVTNESLASRTFTVPVGVGPALPDIGNALFTLAPTFAGSIFDFSINAETFYISQLTVETTDNVPEPSSLFLLGLALVGGVRTYRRRMAA